MLGCRIQLQTKERCWQHFQRPWHPPTAQAFYQHALAAFFGDFRLVAELSQFLNRAIVLDHGHDGEPRVRVFPPVEGRLFVSVSHDSVNAWGLAVFQGGDGD